VVKRPARLNDRALVVLLLLLTSGVAVAGSWQALVSPAPLSPGHKSLEGDCDACHLVFSGVPNDKCMGCHDWIEEKIASKKGFHAGVAEKSCQFCHIDHQGAQGAHTSKEALASFDHEDTGFVLQGAHAKTKCATCHDKPRTKGMQISCKGCHGDDEHKGALGNDCQACHASTGWKDALKKVADHETATDGGHSGLGCKDCHAKGRQLGEPMACSNCHESDNHGGTTTRCDTCHSVAGFKPAKHSHDGCTCQFPGKHQTFECVACHQNFVWTPTPKRCSGCHAKERTHDPLGECGRCHTALSWKQNRFDHNGKRSAFHLENKHLEVACRQCHSEEDKRGRTLFRKTPSDCKSCHEEEGEMVHGDFGDCAQCHTTEGFDKTTFDHGAATGFPLRGKHGQASCQSCHPNKSDGYPHELKTGWWWSGRAPVRLATLHDLMLAPSLQHGAALVDEPVRGDAVRTDARLVHPVDVAFGDKVPADVGDKACEFCHTKNPHKQQGLRCIECHTPVGWKPSTFTLTQHAKTAFPLDNAHTKVECKSCHVKAQLAGIPVECAGCHVDKHAGKLGSSCQDCHTTQAFTPVENFDHTRTGFTLTVQHEAVSCADCHGEKRDADLTAVEDHLDCKKCHQAGHAAFDLDCVSCHLPEDRTLSSATGTTSFDHRVTGFPLERSHGTLACKTCHQRDEPAPIPRCASCHTDPHVGQMGAMSCRSCHAPDRWTVVRFNHDRTGWTLRGRHFTIACTNCHYNQRWAGLPTTCFDCHAGEAARARNVVGGHPFARTDCRECHRSLWRW
jgi:hypothetical protein